ncbi:MAG: TonB-dependent receptor [Candidatus Glassbacteria bacterium]
MKLIRITHIHLIRLLIAAAIFSLLLPITLPAQVAEGKIEGYIRDKDTGQPLAGAQVTVEGTNLGNVTNADGYYFILNVPPGLRTITTSYTGYQKTSVGEQRIMAGYTTTVDFLISSTVISLEGIVVEGESSPLLQRDNVQTRQNLTQEQTAEVPYDDLNSIIGLQAGVRQQGDFNFTIRGGRQNEEALYVDGVLVRNFSTGLNEQSPVDNSTWFKVSPYAIEEVSIITGGFQAEYGNAQSGVVNIVTRGGTEKFSGTVYFKTDEVLPKENKYGFNMLRANVGGPFVTPNSNFFVAVETRGELDQSPRKGEEYGRFVGITSTFYKGFNKLLGGYLSDNGIGYEDLPRFDLPKRGARIGVEGDEYLLSGKLLMPLGQRVTTLLTYSQNRNQGMNFTIQDNLLNMPGRTANLNRTKNGILGIDWDIAKSASSSYSLRLRASGYENLLKDGPIDPGWADDDLSTLGQSDFRDGNLVDGRSTFLNFGLSDYKFLYGDLLNKMDAAAIEQKFGPLNRWEQHLSSPALQNPFWGWGSLVDDGTSVDVLNQRERNATIKLDFDSQLDHYNRIKMGMDAKIISIQGLNLTNFGGITSGDAQDYYGAHPSLFSAYAQDRVDVGDLVVDFGLRWDRMNPRQSFPAEAGAGPNAPQVAPPVSNALSPRIGVSHPVTDRTQFRFSYGHFYQAPAFDLMFSQKNVQALSIWSITGDKDLDFSKTSAFEVGFTSLLSDNLVLDVVGYYRDFEGNLAIRYWVPPYFSQALPFVTNQDYGNSKGVDVTLRRRLVKYLGFDIAYSFQKARGTGSTPDFFERPDRLIDVVTGEYIEPPVRFWPVGNDRTHTLTAQANLRLPEDFRRGSFTGKLLGNTSYYFVQGFSTGGFAGVHEIQALSGSRVPLIDPNSLRGRGGKSTHLRVTKRFALAGRQSISGFLEVRNLIQWNADKGVFPASSDQLTAIQNEFSTGTGVAGTQLIGSYTTNPVNAYKDNPETAAQAALRDYNNDGSISRAEQFVAERLDQAITDGWNAGGSPRLWRFGLEYNF